jgi:C4-dicarboxylate-specific signal transduction histidine kinase
MTSPSKLPVKGDQIQLQQVIMNLIVNAMDAMCEAPVSERKVTISTAWEGKFASIAVSDRGPGIPVDHLDKVFEPFFTTKSQGMGMGLSIAQTIIGAHGGQLTAENLPSGGAVFHARLPLAGQQSPMKTAA